jgi:hypothetical protein
VIRGHVSPGAPGIAILASALFLARPARARDDSGNLKAHARLWVGASLALDFLAMPQGSDVCALSPAGQPLGSPALYCTNPNGSDFPSRSAREQNSLLVPGHAGQSLGGIQGGDVRVMLSVDYALLPNLLLGVRVGYVANAYTGSAAVNDRRAAGSDFHGEGRLTYLFGDEPLATVGLVPMAFAGFGLAEVDGHSLSFVTLSNGAGQPPVNVWRTDGPFFVMIGGGARYQLSPRIAATGALRLNLAVGNGPLITFGPEIGMEYGF